MTRRSRTVLVVSADQEVRAGWARSFEQLGMRTLRCVGPQIACALLDGAVCPLQVAADVAIYDRAVLTPELALRLARANRRVLPIALARDKRDGAGRHEPLVTGVLSRSRTNACIGLAADHLGR
ncbi:MAG TPA: hypothetical protein VGT60_02475 [Candidatus Limnocylindria bacterium]|nr:hypothetical protein [Candidatus Limnocylindria bacterium]